jgi:hypothetical protein
MAAVGVMWLLWGWSLYSCVLNKYFRKVSNDENNLKSSVIYDVITEPKTIFSAYFEYLKPSQPQENNPFKNYFILIH